MSTVKTESKTIKICGNLTINIEIGLTINIKQIKYKIVNSGNWKHI